VRLEEAIDEVGLRAWRRGEGGSENFEELLREALSRVRLLWRVRRVGEGGSTRVGVGEEERELDLEGVVGID